VSLLSTKAAHRLVLWRLHSRVQADAVIRVLLFQHVLSCPRASTPAIWILWFEQVSTDWASCSVVRMLPRELQLKLINPCRRDEALEIREISPARRSRLF
jgi:hypothetical protein